MSELELYPYQLEGARFLANRRRALLADRMGLGKTIQAIQAARIINSSNTLVIGPASSIPNWEAEWQRWGGPGTLEAVSYSSLIRRKGVAAMVPDVVILDEAHYCKNPNAKRTRAALAVAQNAPCAWLLTGTPMPNNPAELWPAVNALWPEIPAELSIKSHFQWMQRFCYVKHTEYGPKPYGVRNGTLLRQILERIALRRDLNQVGLELPPLRLDIFRLKKDDVANGGNFEAYEAYERTEENYTSTLRRMLGEAKALTVARQIIEEMRDSQYSKIVVLYYHHLVRDTLHQAFEASGLRVTGFDGGTPQGERKAAIDLFQNDPEVHVFLAQQAAAGTAITLTAASEIVLVEPAWSPEDNFQAIARVHRIGQGSPCRARIFAVSGTLDEAIMGTLANKVRMLEAAGLKGE